MSKKKQVLEKLEKSETLLKEVCEEIKTIKKKKSAEEDDDGRTRKNKRAAG